MNLVCTVKKGKGNRYFNHNVLNRWGSLSQDCSHSTHPAKVSVPFYILASHEGRQFFLPALSPLFAVLSSLQLPIHQRFSLPITQLLHFSNLSFLSHQLLQFNLPVSTKYIFMKYHFNFVSFFVPMLLVKALHCPQCQTAYPDFQVSLKDGPMLSPMALVAEPYFQLVLFSLS